MGCWRCSVTGSCSTLCDPMDCSTPGFPVLRISRSLLKLVSTESVMPSNHVTLCHPLLLLPSIFPSIRVFSVSVLHIGWPKYWSFSTSSSNKYSGLISLGLTDLFSLQSKGLSRVFSRTTVWKHQFLVAQTVKKSAWNAEDPASILGSGRSPGERNGKPLQYSCLDNSMDRGAWWATVQGFSKSGTWLSKEHFHLQW